MEWNGRGGRANISATLTTVVDHGAIIAHTHKQVTLRVSGYGYACIIHNYDDGDDGSDDD
jgi:hypothetical protein